MFKFSEERPFHGEPIMARLHNSLLKCKFIRMETKDWAIVESESNGVWWYANEWDEIS